MADDWQLNLFTASYNGFELAVEDVSDDAPFRPVEHGRPKVDGSTIEPNGRPARRTRWNVFFTGDGHLAEYTAFANSLDEEPHTLVHPLTGSFQAVVENFSTNANARARQVVVSISFIEASEEPAIYEVADSRNALAGLEGVTNALAGLDTALAAQGQTTTAGTVAEGIVTSWTSPQDSDPPLTRRRVELEMNEVIAAITAESIRLELATTPRLFPAYREFQRLANAVADAAEAVLADTPLLVTYAVEEDIPLIALIGQLYRTGTLEDRFRRTMDLNSIRNPALLLAGTTVVIEEPEV